jgi:hypothetical protein
MVDFASVLENVLSVIASGRLLCVTMVYTKNKGEEVTNAISCFLWGNLVGHLGGHNICAAEEGCKSLALCKDLERMPCTQAYSEFEDIPV